MFGLYFDFWIKKRSKYKYLIQLNSIVGLKPLVVTIDSNFLMETDPKIIKPQLIVTR